MIADTIIVVLVCMMPAKQPKENCNRFKSLFEQTDSAFNNSHKIELEAIRRASAEAAKSAHIKTKREHDKIMSQFNKILVIK